MFSTSSLTRLFALLAIPAAAFATGCGSSSKKSSTGATAEGGSVPSVSKDSKVAAEVPAAVKKKGTLTVAADATYPPNEFLKPGSKQVIGMDADLADALGKVMGVKTNVVNANFDGIIPGLAARKYDLGMSSFTDTKAREKTVDFVTYFSSGTSLYVKAQGGPAIKAVADLCGHKVAVEKGTTQADGATAQGKKCKQSGKPALSVLVFPDQNGANLALSSGRADVGMADSPVAAYQVKKTGGQFQLSGKPYGTAPYGIAMPKKSGLAKPVRDALKVLIAKGAYGQILKKWGIQEGAISKPKINGAIS